MANLITSNLTRRELNLARHLITGATKGLAYLRANATTPEEHAAIEERAAHLYAEAQAVDYALTHATN